ncbi:VIT family protein [Isoptericola sp. b441]|uniref:VIT family protein n=1 Tax=Actinotalea lenta TaxID=3064654 RepID=A0ABT9DDN2_9CELL|nr:MULTISPECIES: VIT family protein [unclassified Isoptericola]MDO8108519.1 VIT family protein [Isoptericola sp. b441]MDO8119929.1 VIT family protein [Isoptericola sp. b490]
MSRADQQQGDSAHDEPHAGNGLKARLNWLRAGVLGANDGIISTAGLVIGVVAATPSRTAIITAGVAGLVAGAVSMALGEYVSVSSARDTEVALIAQERGELDADPEGELQELTDAYRAKGLSEHTARTVAEELTAKDAIRAHLEVEFGLDENDLTNPWHAAVASAVAFTVGALLPLLAVLLAPASASQTARIVVTAVAVLIALVVTGSVSAQFGGAGRVRAVLRLVVGGALAMGVTWGIGAMLGTSMAG